MDILTQDFYARDTLTTARDLLGRDIVRVLEDGTRLPVSRDLVGAARGAFGDWLFHRKEAVL